MEHKNKNKLSRRDFFKITGTAGLVISGLASCHDQKTSQHITMPLKEGKMTYRTNETTGDKVSLLGFGMMRLPSVGGRSAREGNEEIDQEMVNEW